MDDPILCISLSIFPFLLGKQAFPRNDFFDHVKKISWKVTIIFQLSIYGPKSLLQSGKCRCGTVDCGVVNHYCVKS